MTHNSPVGNQEKVAELVIKACSTKKGKKEMKRTVSLVLLAAVLSGCVTATGGNTEASARWKNAGIGAAIGCVATGPFCLLPVGPAIGALIGGMSSVEEKTEESKQVSYGPVDHSERSRRAFGK